ncbi:hypothetical protein TNCV_694611, partial [Trichonephila clavipes]
MDCNWCFTIADLVHSPEAGISFECGTIEVDTNHR